MTEYIGREATIEKLNRLCDRVCQYSKAQRKYMCGACPLGDAFTVIEDDIPAADVRPVRRGKWILYQDRDSTGKFEYVQWSCSACKSNVRTGQPRFDSTLRERPRFNFCPNCGAWMEES